MKHYIKICALSMACSNGYQAETRSFSIPPSISRCALSSFIIGFTHGLCNQWLKNSTPKVSNAEYTIPPHEIISGGAFLTLNYLTSHEIMRKGNPWTEYIDGSVVRYSIFASHIFHGLGQMIGESIPLGKNDVWKNGKLNLSLVTAMFHGTSGFLQNSSIGSF